MFSKEVIELTPACNKALKGLDVKCPKCDGGAMIAEYPGCQTCNGTGKVKYSWTPQAGEWVILTLGRTKSVHLIRQVCYSGKKLLLEPATLYLQESATVTPIIHWETIEKILEKARYEIDIQKGSPQQSTQCRIYPSFRSGQTKGMDVHSYLQWRRKNTIITFGKTRQEAVMLAVVEAGKEMEK